MRAKPTAIQYNMCLHLCQILNQNSGRLACDEAMYYNFLDAYRVTHEAMLKAIQICNPLFRECRYPYIHIRSEKESGHADGEFYLTKSGLDWAKNLPMSDFPAYAELPKEEKPPISREELHAAFNPELPKLKKEKPTWTKEEVIQLMTNEAHVVGHMLGTGYDLLEEIHSTWIKNWILNPYDLRVAIHQAHRDSYKCENPDTEIIMADCTIKKIKDIQIGEYVMGWDSTPRKVIGKHGGYGDMYRVTLNKNGDYYECNGNHVLTLRQTNFKRDKFHCVDKYRDKNDSMIIDIPLKEFIKTPAYLRKKGGNESYFKHFKVGLKNLKQQKVDIPPYILGCWLGDGDTDNIAITTMDEEIAKEFRHWCCSLGLSERIYQRRGKAKRYCYSVPVNKKEKNKVRKIFKNYDLLGNKHIPIEYLNNSKEVRYELLAGLLDTDGNYGKTGHYTYTTVLDNLAKQVEWLARSLGLNATAKQIKTFHIYKGVKKKSVAWQVYINGNDLYKIPVRLERKKAKKKKFKDNRCVSFSQTIEPIGKGDFVGIEIEGDGRYLHGDFTVTHNTTCLRLFIAEMMLLQPLTTIVLLRKSEDAVKEVVNGVSKILDTPLFQTFAAILYPDVGLKGGLKKTTDTALAIDTNLNTSLSGEFQLRALGLGSPLTGKHAKIIITDDICFVAGTKIATPFGDKNIEDLKVGDLVLTPFGYKKITKTHNREARVITNCGLTGTYNHPIYNKNKNLFGNLVDISYNDLSRLNIGELLRWTIIKTLLNGMAENGKKQMENITFLKHLMGKEQAKCCTEPFGKNIMVKFPKVTSFIIKTIIQIIITLTIYSVYLLANIKECMLLKGLNGQKRTCEKKPNQPRWNGLKQMKVSLFVEKILKRHKKNLKNILNQQYVKFAGKNTLQISERQLECVEFVEKESRQEDLKKNARQSEKRTHSMYLLNVANAGKNTEHALEQEIKTDCVKNAPNAREIEKNDFQRVYNIEVEDEHVYYANRILVHNCTTDDRESEAERKNTIAKYQELMNVLSNNKGFSDTRIINIGTPWHEEDVFKLMERGLKPKNDNYKHYEEMLEDPKFSEKRKAHFREMIRKLDMQRGKAVYNCYQTGLMTEEDIEWKKQVLNDDVLFAANYLLTLVSDDEKPFKRINNVGNYSLSFFEDCWEVIGHIDCAYGGDDSTSLSIGGFDYDNFNTVVYGKRWDKIPIDKNYLEVAEILWSCGCTKLWLEKNADKGLMGDKFRELGFDVKSYHESMNKHTKIVSTIRPFWRESGNEVLPCVQFVEETDENYLSQIYDYKKGVAHDDCPDNLACLLIKAKFGNLAVRVT